MIYQNDARETATDLPAIRFQSRPEAIAEQIRNAILTGSLKPGDRLVEQKLATRYGIGQPTLREALKDLELQGFVRKSSKKHTHVTQLTKQDYRKLLEVRLALEPLAIGRAAKNLTEEAGQQLEVCVAAMEAASAGLDLVTFHQNDLRFHKTVWGLAENEHLGTALERVAFVLFAFVLVQRNADGGEEFRASAKQHRQILEGLRTGDPVRARAAFLESTTRFWRENHEIEVDAPDGLGLPGRVTICR
jgi:DNA-binding GntR family transcriptional regulator